jgi:hypothetical protein
MMEHFCLWFGMQEIILAQHRLVITRDAVYFCFWEAEAQLYLSLIIGVLKEYFLLAYSQKKILLSVTCW